MGPAVIMAIVLFTLVVFVYARDPVRAWRHYRGVRLVTCPETGCAAAVSIDTGHAAATAFLEDQADVRLAACSRWASRGPCREPCLVELHKSGDAAKIDRLARQWYAAQSCAYCGKPIAVGTASHQQPAVIGPDGITIQWSNLPPESLPTVFSTHRAVCWNCHVAESFRRLHPDLYFDRSETKQARDPRR